MELQIHGARVYLAHHRDPEGLYALWSDPRVMTSVGWPRGLGLSRQEVKDWIASRYPVTDPAEQNYRLAVYSRHDHSFLGETALGFFGRPLPTEPDLKLLPQYWGQGFATEVVQLVTRFLFTMTPATVIQFTPNVNNAAAIRVYEKCGFQQTGTKFTWTPPPTAVGAVPVTTLCLQLEKAMCRADG